MIFFYTMIEPIRYLTLFSVLYIFSLYICICIFNVACPQVLLLRMFTYP